MPLGMLGGLQVILKVELVMAMTSGLSGGDEAIEKEEKILLNGKVATVHASYYECC